MKTGYNILVTGCGGDIGQSIGKILNESEYVKELYGCDISDKNAGKFIYNNFFLGLPCGDEKYIENLERFVENENIDLVIPVSEPELRFLSKQNILNKIGKAQLITASPKSLTIGFDKLETALFLEENNLPFPSTIEVNKVEKLESFPVILKSKTGSGSSQVFVVDDNETFLFVKKNNPYFIIQEYLAENNGEYTCGVYRSSKGVLRTIILQRELTGGYSGYGEVIENREIETLLSNIAEKLDLIGSINVQLRITKKGPVVFEINPRFSSTVLFRHMFNFKDLIWSIEDKLNIPLSKYVDNSVGRKFYKGFNEYIA